MKKLIWVALVLELFPLFAFAALALLHPVGDPQESHSLLIRLLDFQGTYWMRNARPVPPPLLIAGLLISLFLWRRQRSAVVLVGAVVGIGLLGFWSLIMIVPLLVQVN